MPEILMNLMEMPIMEHSDVVYKVNLYDFVFISNKEDISSLENCINENT